MDTVTKRLYEGLFLVDSGEAASDWDGVNEMIKRILEKSQSEILSIRKWDDRRLAYPIEGKDRGTYILAYFNTVPTNISGIERDIRLSERIMRAMIIRGDQITQADMEKETPAMHPAAAPEPVEAPAEVATVDVTAAETETQEPEKNQ